MKTDAARRRVPLHPTLLQLGFLEFVAGRRRRGATRLFHELPVYHGRCTKEFSKWWGRFTDEHVTKEPHKTFHSFRHLFIAKLRTAKVPEERIKALVGHRSSDTTLGYGDDGEGVFSLAILSSDVEKISFPELDLTKLRLERAVIPWVDRRSATWSSVTAPLFQTLPSSTRRSAGKTWTSET